MTDHQEERSLATENDREGSADSLGDRLFALLTTTFPEDPGVGLDVGAAGGAEESKAGGFGEAQPLLAPEVTSTSVAAGNGAGLRFGRAADPEAGWTSSEDEDSSEGDRSGVAHSRTAVGTVQDRALRSVVSSSTPAPAAGARTAVSAVARSTTGSEQEKKRPKKKKKKRRKPAAETKAETATGIVDSFGGLWKHPRMPRPGSLGIPQITLVVLIVLDTMVAAALLVGGGGAVAWTIAASAIVFLAELALLERSRRVENLKWALLGADTGVRATVLIVAVQLVAFQQASCPIRLPSLAYGTWAARCFAPPSGVSESEVAAVWGVWLKIVELLVILLRPPLSSAFIRPRWRLRLWRVFGGIIAAASLVSGALLVSASPIVDPEGASAGDEVLPLNTGMAVARIATFCLGPVILVCIANELAVACTGEFGAPASAARRQNVIKRAAAVPPGTPPSGAVLPSGDAPSDIAEALAVESSKRVARSLAAIRAATPAASLLLSVPVAACVAAFFSTRAAIVLMLAPDAIVFLAPEGRSGLWPTEPVSESHEVALTGFTPLPLCVLAGIVPLVFLCVLRCLLVRTRARVAPRSRQGLPSRQAGTTATGSTLSSLGADYGTAGGTDGAAGKHVGHSSSAPSMARQGSGGSTASRRSTLSPPMGPGIPRHAPPPLTRVSTAESDTAVSSRDGSFMASASAATMEMAPNESVGSLMPPPTAAAGVSPGQRPSALDRRDREARSVSTDVFNVASWIPGIQVSALRRSWYAWTATHLLGLAAQTTAAVLGYVGSLDQDLVTALCAPASADQYTDQQPAIRVRRWELYQANSFTSMLLVGCATAGVVTAVVSLLCMGLRAREAGLRRSGSCCAGCVRRVADWLPCDSSFRVSVVAQSGTVLLACVSVCYASQERAAGGSQRLIGAALLNVVSLCMTRLFRASSSSGRSKMLLGDARHGRGAVFSAVLHGIFCAGVAVVAVAVAHGASATSDTRAVGSVCWCYCGAGHGSAANCTSSPEWKSAGCTAAVAGHGAEPSVAGPEALRRGAVVLLGLCAVGGEIVANEWTRLVQGRRALSSLSTVHAVDYTGSKTAWLGARLRLILLLALLAWALGRLGPQVSAVSDAAAMLAIVAAWVWLIASVAWTLIM